MFSLELNDVIESPSWMKQFLILKSSIVSVSTIHDSKIVAMVLGISGGQDKKKTEEAEADRPYLPMCLF